MALTSERIDDAALRELALARPGATQQALREALLAGSTAIEALAAADAARYADAAVAWALADPAVLRARAASPNDADDPHVC